MNQLKRFEITLVYRDEEKAFHAKSIDKVEADSLMQLITQFNFILIALTERIKQEAIDKEKNIDWDDIPF